MPGPKAIAYLRVSTADQDIEKDKDSILRLANDKNLGRVEFVQEKVSGKKSWKQRKIFKTVEELAKGDALIVSELSRLGRSMMEIMEILSVLQDKEVQIFTVKGNWTLSGSIESKIIGMVFAIAAEIERDLISQRTKEALRVRKERGIKLGRPKGPGKSKLDEFKDEIIALLHNGSTKTFVAKKYNTTPANLYNWLKRNEEMLSV